MISFPVSRPENPQMAHRTANFRKVIDGKGALLILTRRRGNGHASGEDAGLHRQHVLEHHPGGDRRADHPG
ncbi:hypothetical protein QFZ05_004649, partial [Klebsiella quasipneumoniae]